MKLYKKATDLPCIRQRLFRILEDTSALEASIIACLRRDIVLNGTYDHEDVANVQDRLHEVFNAYSFLTRCNGWHDLDDE